MAVEFPPLYMDMGHKQRRSIAREQISRVNDALVELSDLLERMHSGTGAHDLSKAKNHVDTAWRAMQFAADAVIDGDN